MYPRKLTYGDICSLALLSLIEVNSHFGTESVQIFYFLGLWIPINDILTKKETEQCCIECRHASLSSLLSLEGEVHFIHLEFTSCIVFGSTDIIVLAIYNLYGV